MYDETTAVTPKPWDEIILITKKQAKNLNINKKTTRLKILTSTPKVRHSEGTPPQLNTLKLVLSESSIHPNFASQSSALKKWTLRKIAFRHAIKPREGCAACQTP